jgi:hypothetical protein
MSFPFEFKESAGYDMDLRAIEEEANAQFAKGQIRESARTFQCLSEQLPERLDVQAKLGYLALLGNDLDAAVDYVARVINRGLRSRKALAHLAEAYYRQGRLGSAAYCYQRLGRDGLAGTLAVMGELDAYRLTQPDTSAEVAWVMTDPLPVLAVRVNGRNANLVLDTGAGDTVLDAQFAVDAGVRLGGQEQRTFAGGRPARVTYGHAEELSLGDFGIQDITVQVIDIPPGLAAWFPDLPIHGILGTGVFSRFRTTLDYQSACLRLEPPAETGESQLQNTQGDRPGVPLWLAENQLLLTCVDLPALDKGVWFLDSGMTGSAFAVPVSKVETLGLDVDKGAALVGAGGGGTVQGRKVRADWLRLDRLCRYHQHGVVLDDFPVEQSCGFAVQGLVGHDLLRDSVLTLDFPAMRLFLSDRNR